MSRNPAEEGDKRVITRGLDGPAANVWPSAAARRTAIAPETHFEALFKAHYEGVYRLLYRMVGTREEAEDLAQETFLRFHRAEHLWGPERTAASGRTGAANARQEESGERPHDVRAWLYRVASNLAYNSLRDQGRRLRRQEETVRQAVMTGGGEDDPAELAMRDDQRRSVHRALASLPQRQAQLLLLRHAGLSYRELAEALEVAPGSVGTLLARAEVAFAECYRGGASGQGGEHEV